MKKTFFLLVPLLMGNCMVNAQHTQKAVASKTTPAAKRPEDQVRQYFFVMLSKGESRANDTASAAAIQQGHMANINKLYYAGKLKVAGPFGDDGKWRGIFIFDCASREEVEALLQTDPAIAAGHLTYEVHPWWTAEMGSFKRGLPKKK